MNKNRRVAIDKIIQELEGLVVGTEAIHDEEQEYYDNMPESFQGSEKGERAEQVVSLLDDAMESIRSAVEQLQEAAE